MKTIFKTKIATLLTSLLAGLSMSSGAWADAAKDELIALAQGMEPFSVRVIGPPVGTAEWPFVVKPFWTEMVQELSDGKVNATLNSVTELNAHPGDVFQMTSRGTFDILVIIGNYGAGELPVLDGYDLAGVSGDVETAAKVLQAYSPVVAEALEKRFRLELLGEGYSGAQTFVCRGDINSVDDLKGKKIRVSSSTLSDFVRGFDAVPVSMAFGELVPALQRGVIDCVITGTMATNTSKLYEVTDTMFPLIVGWAPSVQAANQRFMSKLDDTQQEWLRKAMTYYYRNFSDAVQLRNINEGIWCSTGDDRCTMVGTAGVQKGHMKLVEPSDSDRAKAREIVANNVLPTFAESCGTDCAKAWNSSIGSVIELRMPE